MTNIPNYHSQAQDDEDPDLLEFLCRLDEQNIPVENYPVRLPDEEMEVDDDEEKEREPLGHEYMEEDDQTNSSNANIIYNQDGPTMNTGLNTYPNVENHDEIVNEFDESFDDVEQILKIARMYDEQSNEHNEKMDYSNVDLDSSIDSKSPNKPIDLTSQNIESSSMNNDNVICKFSNIEIRQSDLNRLINNEWLNDNIIEIYLQLLIKSSSQTSMYAFNTNYYVMTIDNQYQDTLPPSWAVKALNKVVKFFVPIFHNQNHWSLVFVDSIHHNLFHFDSLYEPSEYIVDQIKSHFSKCASNFKNIQDYSTNYQSKVPKQKNGVDCGVFLCVYARCIILNEEFNFEQKDIPYWRAHILNEIKSLMIFEAQSNNLEI